VKTVAGFLVYLNLDHINFTNFYRRMRERRNRKKTNHKRLWDEIMSKMKRIIRLPAVLDATGQGKSKVYQLIKEGKFPAPVRLGARNVGWIESEVQKWIEDLPRVIKIILFVTVLLIGDYGELYMGDGVVVKNDCLVGGQGYRCDNSTV